MDESSMVVDHALAWRELARVVGEGGRHRASIVPVLGSGVRAWASTRLPKRFTSWEALIQQTAQDIGAEGFTVSGSLTSDFERLVESYRALHPRREPIVVENLLIAQHVVRLLSAEPFAQLPSLARNVSRLMSVGWTDIIDLGIDDVFSRPAGPQDVVAGSLSGARTTMVRSANGPRFWHPHGSVRAERAPSQVVLGVERYGRSVSAAVTAFQRHAQWVKQHPVDAGKDVRATDFPLHHWVPLALHAPLLLLGTSLGEDDWDMLWFLRMRRRAQAIHGVRTPVFRLTCGADEDARRSASARPTTDILPLYGGRTWKDAWERFFDALDG
jgi:hypothetical protein